jgi:hypothetical protein
MQTHLGAAPNRFRFLKCLKRLFAALLRTAKAIPSAVIQPHPRTAPSKRATVSWGRHGTLLHFAPVCLALHSNGFDAGAEVPLGLDREPLEVRPSLQPRLEARSRTSLLHPLLVAEESAAIVAVQRIRLRPNQRCGFRRAEKERQHLGTPSTPRSTVHVPASYEEGPRLWRLHLFKRFEQGLQMRALRLKPQLSLEHAHQVGLNHGARVRTVSRRHGNCGACRAEKIGDELRTPRVQITHTKTY